MITLTIKIADPGTLYGIHGETSTFGHMWLSLDGDGIANPMPAISMGYGPNDTEGVPFGAVYPDDDEMYGSTYYTGTICISDAQYSQLIAFGKNPSNYGFDINLYAGWNNCVDFVWKALEVAGLNSSGFNGDFWPTWNADDIDRVLYTYLFKEFSGWQSDKATQGGYDVIYGSSEDDDLQAQIWTDAIYGGEGNDTITGNNLTNYLEGNDGADALIGRGGNDVLRGGSGDDSIDGGIGNDTLEGGAGSDTYIYNSGDGFDAITDLRIVLGKYTNAENPGGVAVAE
jgi:RTX calcium-binding nonapeptide repeat (4 copies)